MKQKEKESQVLAAEAEFNRLNRRVQELEEDLETTETKFVQASQKLDKAATTADDSDRMKKVLENRAAEDEKKLIRLAEELKEAQKMAEDADRKYDDTQKKMGECERNLEVSEERASAGEFKIIELEEELKVVANNLKSLEVSEDKANQRETFYKDEIKRLTGKLKQSETRAEFAERSVVKLQKEVRGCLSQVFPVELSSAVSPLSLRQQTNSADSHSLMNCISLSYIIFSLTSYNPDQILIFIAFRSTDWRMSCSGNRTSLRPSPKSWTRPLLK